MIYMSYEGTDGIESISLFKGITFDEGWGGAIITFLENPIILYLPMWRDDYDDFYREFQSLLRCNPDLITLEGQAIILKEGEKPTEFKVVTNEGDEVQYRVSY